MCCLLLLLQICSLDGNQTSYNSNADNSTREVIPVPFSAMGDAVTCIGA